METKTNTSFPDVTGETNEQLREYIEAVKNGNTETINRTSELLKKHILTKVDDAILELYKHDVDLLISGMNEMTISGRLAFYLQNLFNNFSGYYVDIEYYRLKVSRGEVRDIRKDRIRCDIILHARGKYNTKVDNLLAIEVKLERSDDNGDSDLCRIAEFVLPDSPNTPKDAVHSTLVGLFLRFGENGYGKAIVTNDGYIDMTQTLENEA